METNSENLRGIVLMIASMAFFAIEDMFIKLIAVHIGVGQILMLLGLIGGSFFVTIMKLQGQKFDWQQLKDGALLLRTLADVMAALSFVTALSLIPLSNASAILQATPLFVTLGAALFLGEKVRWRRWAAIAVGFVGVLLVVQPGSDGFTTYSFFAVAGMLLLAARDVITRRIDEKISSLFVSALAFGAMIIPSAILMLATTGWQPMSLKTSTQLITAGIIGLGGYYMVTQSMRMGEVSVIAPFRYSRLVFALLLGIFILGERPDQWMIIGSILIVVSGIYTFYRERRSRGL